MFGDSLFWLFIAVGVIAAVLIIKALATSSKGAPKKTDENRRMHGAIDALARCRQGDLSAWPILERALKDNITWATPLGITPDEKRSFKKMYEDGEATRLAAGRGGDADFSTGHQSVDL